MLVSMGGYLPSLRSLTKICTYIKKNHAVRHSGHTAGSTQSIHCSFAQYGRQKNARQHNTLSPSPRSHLLLLSSSFLPPPQDIRVSTNPSYPPPPLCHLSARPSGGSLRGWEETCVCLLRRSPQLHGASASPACRHAAIHRLITMEERSCGWVKVGCADCNQLPVAVFYALNTTFHFLHAPQPPESNVTTSWQVK